MSENNNGDGLSTAMYAMCVLGLLGTIAYSLQLWSQGMNLFLVALVPGVGGSLVFAVLGVLLDRAARTQALVEWTARQIQEMQTSKTPVRPANSPIAVEPESPTVIADPVDAWEKEQSAKAGPPPPPSGWQDRLAER